MKKNFFLLLLLTIWMQYMFATDVPINKPQLQKEFARLDSIYKANKEENIKEALRVSEEQERIASLLTIDSLPIIAKLHKAQSLLVLGFLDIALAELYKGLKESESKKYIYYQYRYLNVIGQVFQERGDFKQAQSYYEKAKHACIQNKNYADTLAINYDIAACFRDLGEAEKGLSIVKSNLKVAKETKNGLAIFFGFENLAGIYAMTGKLAESLNEELSILAYPESYNNNYRKNVLYNHLAELYKEQKTWDKAQQFTDSTHKYARAIKSNAWIMGVYRLQSRIDEGRGDYKNALKLHRQYLALKDSVFRESYDVKMAAMASYHELETKQNQIAILEKDNDLKRSQRNGILLLALLAMGLIAVYFVLKHQKEKQKMQLLFSQQLLQSQEDEKKKIAQELHDSIGQNVLFIKNQLSKQNTDKQLSAIIDTVDSTIEDVRNIAKDLYPNQLEKYGLSAAVEALGEKVSESKGIFISADFHNTEQYLSKEATIHLYRIIQESINNTIKHAAATAIRITAETNKGSIDFLIQDNGKGFEKSILAKKQQRSFGLLGMEERVKMLNGKFDIESTVGSGTKLLISLPYVQNHHS